MPLIKPFRALIYNKKKVKDLSRVVAPPYDVIPPAMQSHLYKKDKNNIVRLILGKIKKTDDMSDNRYTRAKSFLDSWLDHKILIEDEKESIYIYSQRYEYDGRWRERTGYISALRLELGKRKAVLPHENTLKAPKADRLNLMRSVNANLSPIFMLYEDNKGRLSSVLKKAILNSKPFIDINIYGIRNRVWRLTDEAAIKKIEKFMAGKNIFIADGHHRYETAVNYAQELESGKAPKELKESSKYTLAYFCELDESSLTILPTHRLIKDIGPLKKQLILGKLGKYFKIERCGSVDKLISRLRSLRDLHAFGMYAGNKEFYCIILKKESEARSSMGKGSSGWKSLDVSILHKFIIQNILDIRDEDDNIEFVKDAGEAIKLTDSGKYKIAFLLNPTKVLQMKKIAQAGEKMPRKATYFYPKPLSGLVIRKF